MSMPVGFNMYRTFSLCVYMRARACVCSSVFIIWQRDCSRVRHEHDFLMDVLSALQMDRHHYEIHMRFMHAFCYLFRLICVRHGHCFTQNNCFPRDFDNLHRDRIYSVTNRETKHSRKSRFSTEVLQREKAVI